nr:MAG TPA: hypothetical protein [Caudoviricetes sp.]
MIRIFPLLVIGYSINGLEKLKTLEEQNYLI